MKGHVKGVYCLISSAFIGASLVSIIGCDVCDSFAKSLDESQRIYYSEVSEERLRIYIQGLIIGILLGFVVLYVFYRKLNPLVNACLFTATVLMVQYLYYILSPKTKSIITKLTDKNQINKWAESYRYMQLRYYGGFLLGGIGYMLFGYLLCDSC